MRLSVAPGEVGVVDAGLVNPDGLAQHDPVMVVEHRGERAVPLLKGRLVGDTAQLGRALNEDVVAHEPDEGEPDGGGLHQCSRTVPVRDVDLLPLLQLYHLGTPVALGPSHQAPRAPHPGHPGSGR